MDKGRIRVALAALSVAGLLAGVTMTGCRSVGSCTGGSCTAKMQQQHQDASSCTGSMESKPDVKPKM